MPAALDEIIGLVSAQLGQKSIEAEDRFLEDLGAESADIVNIIAAVEDSFGIRIREEEIGTLRTPIDLHRLVTEKQR